MASGLRRHKSTIPHPMEHVEKEKINRAIDHYLLFNWDGLKGDYIDRYKSMEVKDRLEP